MAPHSHCRHKERQCFPSAFWQSIGGASTPPRSQVMLLKHIVSPSNSLGEKCSTAMPRAEKNKPKSRGQIAFCWNFTSASCIFASHKQDDTSRDNSLRHLGHHLPCVPDCELPAESSTSDFATLQSSGLTVCTKIQPPALHPLVMYLQVGRARGSDSRCESAR